MIVIRDKGLPVSTSIEISCRVQNFLGMSSDAMFSYGCKYSEVLFEVERKEEKFILCETWQKLDPKKAQAQPSAKYYYLERFQLTQFRLGS